MSEGPSPEQQGPDPQVGRQPPAAGASAGQPPASPANATGASAAQTPSGVASAARACENCGAPLKPDQDWCLQCGAGANGERTGPGWRTAAAAIGASAVLALGAAAAAYAALKQGSPPPATPVSTVAQAPPATTTTATTTSSATATTTPSAGAGLPATGSKPPKIPAHASTPESGGTSGEAPVQGESESGKAGSKGEGSETNTQEGQSGTGTETVREDEEEACKASRSAEDESSASEEGTESSTETTTTQTSTTEGEQSAGEQSAGEQSAGEECAVEEGTHGSKPAPIPLEAKDASTYDPNAYPESDFTSPELAIDGIATTAWTAAPAAELAPKAQAGLLLNLEGDRRIAKLGLISRTLGMTVQIYGTTQRKPPKSITASGWVKLSGVHLVEQRSSSISLRRTPKIRQLLVWVLRAPEVEPEVEGEEVEESVAINEVALYEPK